MQDYTIRCSACKQHLPYSEFPLKRNNTRDSFCRECKKIYQKKHYKENTQYYKSRAKQQQEWIVEDIRQIKATTPCADCGKIYHFCVMDFDHREGETKLFEMSKARHRGQKNVELEIAKCDVVCANCHRIRTYNRSGHFDRPRSKKTRGLTPKQRDQIRTLHATGRFTHKQIAQRYGVDKSAISHLLRGKTYKTRRAKVYSEVNDILADEKENN